MKNLIKRDLLIYKQLKFYIAFIVIILFTFLFVVYINDWLTNDIFLQISGSITSDLNFSSTSILLIVNGSILGYTVYLYTYDLLNGVETIFLRLNKIKKWLINKFISLLIIDIINILLCLLIFHIFFAMFNTEAIKISFLTIFNIVLTKYLFQMIIIFLYNFTKYLYLLVGVILITSPIYFANTGIIYVNFWQKTNIYNLETLYLIVLCSIMLIINYNCLGNFKGKGERK